MKITYRVINTLTGKDITDNAMWVLEPNGRLAYDCYGDLIGDPDIKAIFTIEDEEAE